MKPALLALGVMLGLSAAAAAERPVLKGNLTVTGSVITLGDLVDNAGPSAKEALFQAPDLGTIGTIQAWRIAEAARGLGVENIDLRNIQSVRVERPGRLANPAEITDLVAQEFMVKGAIADRERVVVQLDQGVAPIRFDAPAEARLKVDNLVQDNSSGRFEALISLDGPAGRQRQVRVNGFLTELIDALRLRRTVGKGEAVSPDDVTVERVARTRAAGDIAASFAEIQGLVAKRALADGTYVRGADLEKPKVIARNDPVTIVLETRNMVLSVRGKALDSGAVGDVIDVQNANSKRVVQATILGPGKVGAHLNGQRQTASVSSSPRETATP